MTRDLLASTEGLEILAQATPIATSDYADPDEIAEVIAFLANLRGNYLLGQAVFVDGGTDAIMRPDNF